VQCAEAEARALSSDLRRWGLKLAQRGGKSGKKRAIIAVARKLAVLLHHLWVGGEVYEPLRNRKPTAMPAAAKFSPLAAGPGCAVLAQHIRGSFLNLFA